MNRTEQQFFALLRAGLWSTDIDEDLFSGIVDWDAIVKIAQMQTVSGVVFDGISALSKHLQAPAPVMRKLYQTVIRIEQSHELLNRRLAEVVTLLHAEGIPAVLLKGQGVAQNYPNPVRRQCGDIDLYVGRQLYGKACELARELGGEDEPIESEKHYHFQFGDVAIELHRIADRPYNPFLDTKFQHWTQRHLAGNKLRKWELNGTQIALPPVHFDALFIFNHLYRHFINGGIGLRQLCDWVLYLEKFQGAIDQQQLYRDLKSFGLLRTWRIFGCLSVEYLGLSAGHFSFYDKKYRKKSQKALSIIMETGNFGKYNPELLKRPKGYFSGKLHSLKLRNRRVTRIFFIAPLNVTVFYISALITSVIVIIKGK